MSHCSSCHILHLKKLWICNKKKISKKKNFFLKVKNSYWPSKNDFWKKCSKIFRKIFKKNFHIFFLKCILWQLEQCDENLKCMKPNFHILGMYKYHFYGLNVCIIVISAVQSIKKWNGTPCRNTYAVREIYGVHWDLKHILSWVHKHIEL